VKSFEAHVLCKQNINFLEGGECFAGVKFGKTALCVCMFLFVSRSAGGFGCYMTCPNAVSSRVIHLVFHRLQHNCFSSLDSIKLVYQHPLERRNAATDSYKPGS
jgi:hypothetical protein